MQIIQYGAIKELGSTVLDFQVALVVKNPSAIIGDIDMWIPSLGQEDPLEKGMATHSSILAWRIPWMGRSLVGYNPWGCKESGTTEQLHSHLLCFFA